MAKSLTIKNKNNEILYPKTVSSLVYDNSTGNTVKLDLDNKLESSDIKTVNGISLVGSGNITIVGEKGDTGNVTVTDGVAQITIVNDLTTGGTGDALSAEMGKRLGTKVNKNASYISIIRNILELAVFKGDVSSLFDALDSLDQEVTSITLNESSISINGFGSQTLVATTDPSTARVSWTSSDTSVATVSDGVVTSVGNGTCTITAIAGSLSATCSVTVSGVVPIEYVDFEGDNVAKAIVLANYPHPTNANEITTAEAAAVTSLFVNGTSPFANTAITNANWLRHFTGIYLTEDVSSNTKGFGKEFSKCQSLTSIVVPEGIQHLCQDGMYQCTALSNITLPSTLTLIAIRGLYCVHTTGVITLKATNCSLSYSGFSGITSEYPPQAIYVPSSSVSSYQGKSNWSNFASVILAITE